LTLPKINERSATKHLFVRGDKSFNFYLFVSLLCAADIDKVICGLSLVAIEN